MRPPVPSQGSPIAARTIDNLLVGFRIRTLERDAEDAMISLIGRQACWWLGYEKQHTVFHRGHWLGIRHPGGLSGQGELRRVPVPMDQAPEDPRRLARCESESLG
jgi:hypothetical protein